MITSLEEVKTNLGFINPDEARDARISNIIPKVEADYLKIRMKDFDLDDNGDIVYPDGSAYTASEMIGYLLEKRFGIKSESLPGGYSFTSEDALIQGYPKSIVGSIKKYAKLI